VFDAMRPVPNVEKNFANEHEKSDHKREYQRITHSSMLEINEPCFFQKKEEKAAKMYSVVPMYPNQRMVNAV